MVEDTTVKTVEITKLPTLINSTKNVSNANVIRDNNYFVISAKTVLNSRSHIPKILKDVHLLTLVIGAHST